MTNIFQDKIVGNGRMDVPVKGASYCQSVIEALCNDDGFDGVNLRCTARLISEPTNQYDRHAVRVEIAGHPVGYLPRNLAASFHHWLDRNGYASINAPCDAMIVGGWGETWTDDGIETEAGTLGVRLDLMIPGQVLTDEAIDSTQEHVFAPMRQSRIEGDVLKLEMEHMQLLAGGRVNFWLNKNDESLIVIFASGGCGGSGRIGLVPDKYYNVVASHLRDRLPIDARIDRIEDGICFIRFKLVPREAVEQAQHEATERQRAALSKPYKPIKPMQTVIVPASAECQPLRKGTKLLFNRIPILDECLGHSRGPTLVFSTEDGSSLYVADDHDFKCRVFRLGDLRSTCLIKVTGTNRTGSYVSYDIEISLLKL